MTLARDCPVADNVLLSGQVEAVLKRQHQKQQHNLDASVQL